MAYAKQAENDRHRILSCSLCGKTQSQVFRLFAGLAGNVCDECVDLCADILAEARAKPDDRKERLSRAVAELDAAASAEKSTKGL